MKDLDLETGEQYRKRPLLAKTGDDNTQSYKQVPLTESTAEDGRHAPNTYTEEIGENGTKETTYDI